MIRKALFGILTLVAISSLMSSAAFADVQIRVFDGAGSQLTECAVLVETVDGEMLEKFGSEANGNYDVAYAEPGDKLVIKVSDSSGTYVFNQVAPGNGELNLIVLGAPANDNCDAAIGVAVPADETGSTTGATTDPGAIAAGFCGTSVSNPSAGVWYTVVGTGTTLTATTCNAGTDYDTKLTVFCQDCEDLECIGGNDDQAGGFDPACDVTGIGFNRGSTVSFCTEAGATYSIFVHGFLTSVGNFQLTAADTGATCTADVSCLPPVPTGACCTCLNPPFNCSIETAEMCAATGGEYQGDDSTCFVMGMPFDYSSSPGVGIPDNDDVGVSDTISVIDDVSVADLDVGLVIDHTWVGDLTVTLTSPSGTSITIWDTFCGNQDNMDVLLDDDGADVVCASPITGVVNPASVDGGALSGFAGESALGDWTLNVADGVGLDTGTLISWSLGIMTAGPPVCEDTSGGGGDDCPDDEDEDEDEDEDSDETADLPDDDDDDGSGDGSTQNLTLEDSDAVGFSLSPHDQEADEPQERDTDRKVNRKTTRKRSR